MGYYKVLNVRLSTFSASLHWEMYKMFTVLVIILVVVLAFLGIAAIGL